MKTIAARTSGEAAAIWWTNTLYTVRGLYDEAISHDVCLGDLQPLYSYHLNNFRSKLKQDLEFNQPASERHVLSVIDGTPCEMLRLAAEAANISVIYLKLLNQTVMWVSPDRVELSEGEMSIFKEIWRLETFSPDDTPKVTA